MGLQILLTEQYILQDAREKLGLTQTQVADKAGIKLRQYQKFENGERNLSSSSFDIARRVLRALGLDMSSYARGDYSLSSEEEGDQLLREYFTKSKPEDAPQTDAFRDKLCVFIGRLERCSKRDAQERLFAAGGVPQNNVTAIVSFVITGKGAEDTKAYAEAKRYEKYGMLSIITERMFFDILDGKAAPPEKPEKDKDIARVEAAIPGGDELPFAELIERKRAAYIASKRFVVVAED